MVTTHSLKLSPNICVDDVILPYRYVIDASSNRLFESEKTYMTQLLTYSTNSHHNIPILVWLDDGASDDDGGDDGDNSDHQRGSGVD